MGDKQQNITIADKRTAERYVWGKDCLAYVLANSLQLSVKQEVMPPGTAENKHLHKKATQFFYVLNGTASFHIGGSEVVLSAQQGVLIEPGTKHFIANNSNEVLEFLVISQPAILDDRFEE